ncbi:MAG: mannose-1-phosphate guanylyltransferase/mannose-6-phosphate isomerase [Thermodesulfobacteriota bacterium]
MKDICLPIYPVLLAGGSGTRLWPVSRELFPKQLAKLCGEDSLVQATIKRIAPVLDTDRIRVVCGNHHAGDIERHLQQIDIDPKGKIVAEPCGRNTAPAVLLALHRVLQEVDDAVVFIFPADHVIRHHKRFQEKILAAARLAEAGSIVTFGIKPYYPETGYGYIEGGDPVEEGARRIRRFVEKPDRATAEHYLQSGNFYWNSGMFAFRASVMAREFERYQPDMSERFRQMMNGSTNVSAEDYASLPNVSIDVAVMEYTRIGVVLPADLGWSDIGSWKSLYDFLPKDESNNVILGDVILQQSDHCFVMTQERMIAVNGLSRIVIVETPDAVFVSDMETSRDVKEIVAVLKAQKRLQVQKHTTVTTPWGTRTTLEVRAGYQVHRLNVFPKERVAVAADPVRIKTLVLVDGTAQIHQNGDIWTMKPGENVTIAPFSEVELTVCNETEEEVHLMEIETAHPDGLKPSSQGARAEDPALLHGK